MAWILLFSLLIFTLPIQKSINNSSEGQKLEFKLFCKGEQLPKLSLPSLMLQKVSGHPCWVLCKWDHSSQTQGERQWLYNFIWDLD